jgi:multiple sugar transport system permease protein
MTPSGGSAAATATTSPQAVARAADGRRRGDVTPPHRRRKFGPFPFIAVAPAIVLVLAIMVFPIGSTIYHSFTSWDGTTTRFIGIENFRLLWQDSVLREVLVNSLIFLISVPVILLAYRGGSGL